MPASENFAGNQDNWGASATDGWGTANAGATGANTNEWNAPSAPTTGVTGSWWFMIKIIWQNHCFSKHH
jgi:hypothetical protein